MKTPFDGLEGPAKVLAICAAIVFVGMGLCGLEWAIAGAVGGAVRSRGQHMLPALVIAGIIQGVAVIVAVVVGGIATIVLLVRAITGRRL
ncbi:MAG: hypothetical protein ABR928_04865 [Terracidiphilus sp.]|jgi:hypothetical protein